MKTKLSSGYVMNFRLNDDRTELSEIKLEGKNASFRLYFSEEKNRLDYRGDYYRAKRLLPRGLLRDIEDNCRYTVRRER